MTRAASDPAPFGAPVHARSVALARGVSATSWYTAISLIVFTIISLAVWFLAIALNVHDNRTMRLLAFGFGAACVLAGIVVLLARYRGAGLEPRSTEASLARAWPLVTGLIGSVLVGFSAASPLFGSALAATLVIILPRGAHASDRVDAAGRADVQGATTRRSAAEHALGRGARWRISVGALALMAALWWFEQSQVSSLLPTAGKLPLAAFAFMLPMAAAMSLWSWDVVLELDRARATEARLAAAQERLMLANDLHDLQGHHLQVIALQLELAERLIARDAVAAAEQIALARTSVDDARRGTRELAGRFRGVPLPDELANAADLLRAAGLRVELTLAPDAADAPSEVFGPIIRESTTNVLKHGGGQWAALSLGREGDSWVLAVRNGVGDDLDGAAGEGAGLEGIARRAAAAGGTRELRVGEGSFALAVRIPKGERA